MIAAIAPTPSGTKANERDRVAKCDRAGDNECAVFAEAVTRDDGGSRAAFLFPRPPDGDRGREHQRLRVAGQVERLGRTVFRERPQIVAERVGSFAHRRLHDRVRRESSEHADLLRALSGEYEREFHVGSTSI